MVLCWPGTHITQTAGSRHRHAHREMLEHREWVARALQWLGGRSPGWSGCARTALGAPGTGPKAAAVCMQGSSCLLLRHVGTADVHTPAEGAWRSCLGCCVHGRVSVVAQGYVVNAVKQVKCSKPDPKVTASRGFWARGALCMAVSTLIMTTSALCVKLINGRVPLFEVVVRAHKTMSLQHI